ncbi:muramidase family protein [Microbacterium sp.]|uniref:muramidase family protein n=1 Tax=Microbacterium sp. TaxID=51671 RepID=UPI00281155BB|nr:LysM peptidoglycan-binding domain-containing protein [Microbacterium sp.]
MTAPAAVIGTLAAVLTAAPAEAQEPRSGALSAMTPRSTPAAAGPLQAVAVAVRPAATASPATHVVKPGDTVWAVARKYGLRTADVLSWNGLTPRSVIYPGQRLRLTGAAAAPASAPAPRPAATSTAATTHTVVRGDTVYAIAKKYRTTVAKIIAANGLGRSAIIYPGQKLTVSTAAPTAAPVPAAAVSKPAAPPAATGAHKVVAGDTLYGIAKKYGTTVSALLAANGLGNGSIIYPGQTLRLAPPTPGQRFASLDAAQKANAVRIIRIGRELGVPDRGIAIALATAMVESSLRNLDYGDRDSLGLFQQRPSYGWGTAAQILDADRSIRVFYGGAQDPNGSTTRGLLDIPGWQTKSFTGAAQAVQISAFPDRYGQWEQQARQWLATLG